MKKFITGLIVGLILASAMPIQAAIEEYILYRVDYKIVINEQEYVDEELPVLNYKDNIYVPLRSILGAAGLSVNWNAELNQAEITREDSGFVNNEKISGYFIQSHKYDFNNSICEIFPPTIFPPAVIVNCILREQEQDNELFIHRHVFEKYIIDKGPGLLTIALPDKPVFKITVDEMWNEGTNGTFLLPGLEGGIYIKASALGLTYKIKGDTVIIE